MREYIDYEKMGNRIRAVRKEQKMTQGALAKKVGVSTALIGHIERALKRPSLDVFAGICEVLKMDAHYILYGTEFVGEGNKKGRWSEEIVEEMRDLRNVLEKCLESVEKPREEQSDD